MKITLLRHTEVDEAYHKCYNGHIDIGLSQRGEEQAKHLAKQFKNSSFDGVYCSDLRRTRETLKPFIQVKQAIYTDKLREKSWGKHEGMTFDAIIQEGEFQYENFLQWIEALDGENYGEYIERIEAFFIEFLFLQDVQNVLVVTHAGVIKVLVSIIQKITLEEAFALDVSYASALVLNTEDMSISKFNENMLK